MSRPVAHPSSRSLSALLHGLPPHIAERVFCVPPAEPEGAAPLHGEYVLYWMRTAVRGHENPALDAALLIAAQLGLPAFVYHALSERYPYASDRHHRFILEGARDVAAELAERGVGYAFHLERPGHRGPHLRTLATRAAVVITEDLPVAPLAGWTTSLAASIPAPVLAVDTACILPMRKIGRAWLRAFAFRAATGAERLERAQRPWPPLPGSDQSASKQPFVPTLPFQPIDLAHADLAELIAACEIDHLVAPVAHTVGGSQAGYRRWQDFLDTKLRGYAERRSDALVQGTSRMSAYLHYGQVSPLRIAREAAQRSEPDAEKFLDELLTWRDLAHVYCAYTPDHDTVAGVPEWARKTLREHQSDQRPGFYSWERLARGETGEPLWDAAQRSLLIHGELHNSVRMTWGKAIIPWTPDLDTALPLLIDLNHRYALDGRDPASYGGILWCFGQFDRPFPPSRPCLGIVRSKSLRTHAQSLSPLAYSAQVSRPASVSGQLPSVAVIGAGMAGLLCARTLADHRFSVQVFDKGRGPGGRMATRRTGDLAFDHGAQYFIARDPRFGRYVESWRSDGIVSEWQGRLGVLRAGEVVPKNDGLRRFVGTPGMSAVSRHLARSCNVRYGVRVGEVARQDGRWQLRSESGEELGTFDAVVLALPAPQAVPLLNAAPALAAQAAAVATTPCWAVMAAFAGAVDLPLDGAFIHGSPLSWAARDGSKAGRPQRQADGSECWVLHAGAEWSTAHLEDSPTDVAAALLDAFAAAVGKALPPVASATAHRWRYALTATPAESQCLYDPSLRIGACGDWCGGARVEAAFLSGMAMAGRIGALIHTWPAA